MKSLKPSLLCKSALSAVAAATLCLPALAQTGSFPTKPVTIVTAFAAGSGPDAVLRQVSVKLSQIWNQPVLVNNKPGGGGFIAIESTQRAATDGYKVVLMIKINSQVHLHHE